MDSYDTSLYDLSTSVADYLQGDVTDLYTLLEKFYPTDSGYAPRVVKNGDAVALSVIPAAHQFKVGDKAIIRMPRMIDEYAYGGLSFSEIDTLKYMKGWEVTIAGGGYRDTPLPRSLHSARLFSLNRDGKKRARTPENVAFRFPFYEFIVELEHLKRAAEEGAYDALRDGNFHHEARLRVPAAFLVPFGSQEANVMDIQSFIASLTPAQFREVYSAVHARLCHFDPPFDEEGKSLSPEAVAEQKEKTNVSVTTPYMAAPEYLPKDAFDGP